MAIDIRRRMSGENRRGDLKGLVRSRVALQRERLTGRIVHAVTIKGIDKTDGATVWEYGPGSHWRHHYGADAITGIVPDLAAELDKYAVAAAAYPVFQSCGNRNTASLGANVAEAISLVKLNSLDGSTVEESVISGFFCSAIAEASVTLIDGITVTNSAALSGGDFVIVGSRIPIIEFVDFGSNGTDKQYILHAHGQQAGNVYLKTRTSSETITIPRDATAGEVEALFEGTADCISATATGGPWPLLAISIEVVWSASSGDISAISATDTYNAVGLSTVWDYTNDTATSIGVFTLTFDIVTLGDEVRLEFPDGTVFTYTALTDDEDAFIAAMGAALGTFVALNTGLVPADDPGEVQWAGHVLTVNFMNVSPHIGPIDATLTSSGGITDSRRAGSCAASYDTGTGEMTSAVGYVFGFSADRPTLRMFADDEENPTVTGLNTLGILAIGSGPSDALIITPSLRGSGDAIKASVVERWDVSGGEWSFVWQVFCNAEMAMPQVILCESGYFMCEILPKRFGDPFTGDDRTAARIAVSDTTVDEISRRYASLSSGGAVISRLYDDLPSLNFCGGISLRYQDTVRPNNNFRTTVSTGDDADVNGTYLRLGALPFGADATSVFGTSYGETSVFHYEPAFTYDTEFYITFFPTAFTRSTEPQQFRFRFANNATTAWLDWYATAAEIRTALLDLMGENSDPPGFPSNVYIYEWPDLPMENDPYPTIESRMRIFFQVAVLPGTQYIDPAYFSSDVGRITIEVQTVTALSSPPGISAYDISDASLIWSRAWGTVGATAISQPQYAWLQGDFVYAYGSIVDSEL